jgi:RecJ-like exonuclease
MAVKAHCDRCNMAMHTMTPESMAEILRKKQPFICKECNKKDELFNRVADKWKAWAINEANRISNTMRDELHKEIQRILSSKEPE